MTGTKIKAHPTEIELAGFLDRSLPEIERREVEAHISSCDDCLKRIVSAHESVAVFNENRKPKKGKKKSMNKISLCLVLAIITFSLSFITPRYFIQLLVATLILGIKWIADAKSTRMLVMIYEAWKKGGEKEASRILETLENNHKNRL